MEWNALYGADIEPSPEDINAYIGSDLWGQLNSYLQDTYKTVPKLFHSRCTGLPGWNVKYKKGGKSLCTLYPKEGYFVALIVIGNKELPETELHLPAMTGFVRALYETVPFSCGGKWLMINVTRTDIMNDVMHLIAVRSKAK